MIVKEFETRSNPNNTSFEAFDEFEMRDIALSRLVVESLLTSNFYEKLSSVMDIALILKFFLDQDFI